MNFNPFFIYLHFSKNTNALKKFKAFVLKGYIFLSIIILLAPS